MLFYEIVSLYAATLAVVGCRRLARSHLATRTAIFAAVVGGQLWPLTAIIAVVWLLLDTSSEVDSVEGHATATTGNEAPA